MTDNRLTQEALEQWASGTPSVQLTQAAVEHWGAASFTTIQAVLTQIAIEQWGAPTNGAGGGGGGGAIMPSNPTYGVPTPTGTLQGCAVFQWDGATWQPSGLAAAGVGTPTGVLRGVAPFTWSGSAWTPAGGGPDVATAGGVLDGVALYTWSGSAWTPAGGIDTATPTGVLQGVAVFTWDGTAWQPSGQAGPDVATPTGVLQGVALFNWGGTSWNNARNYVTNSTMRGAVAGTPGTLPTGWLNSIPTGVSQQIVGTGTVNGIPYIDIRFFGSSAANNTYFYTSGPNVTTSPGVSWAISGYLARVGGSNTNISNIYFLSNYMGASSLGLDVAPSLTATLTRFTASGAAPAGTTAITMPFVGIIANASAIDITLRFGAPQLEQAGAAGPFLPT